MLTDHSHFKTKDNIVFTTRGFYHPSGYIRAIPLYKNYIEREGLEKSVDEFGDIWLSKIHPEYIKNSSLSAGILVPFPDISRVYDPFNASGIIKDLQDPIGNKIINFLLCIGIDESDIGFLGSYLIDTGHKPRDIDFIIRGLKNLSLIKGNFNDLLKKISGVNYPPEEYVESALTRYENKYNKEFNSFREIIQRRWPTINVPKRFFGKLRFTYKREEVPPLELPLGQKIPDISLTGRVIEDTGTSFMPRNFVLSVEDKNIKVYTYFWDFAYCAKEKDVVSVRGDFFPESKMILICNPKKHGVIIKR